MRIVLFLSVVVSVAVIGGGYLLMRQAEKNGYDKCTIEHSERIIERQKKVNRIRNDLKSRTVTDDDLIRLGIMRDDNDL